MVYPVSGHLSILSSFIRGKVTAKGWSVKKFAEEAGIHEKYAYKLLSAKRDFTPTEETLGKIAGVLELNKEDRDFVFDIAMRERESGSIIYPEDVPSEPEPAPSPSPEVPPSESLPSDDIPSETHPEESPHPPEVPPEESIPEPSPYPIPSEPCPSCPSLWEQFGLWVKEHRLVIIVIGAVFLVLLMMSCCFLSGLLWPVGL